MNRTALRTAILIASVASGAVGSSQADELQIFPSKVVLRGKWSQQQIVVFSRGEEGTRDLTRSVRYSSSSPDVATVGEDAVIRPSADGQCEIRISGERDGQPFERSIPVLVSKTAQPLPVDFAQDIQPILSKFACNSGPCHGKARGQNGFQLSLLGFDSGFDYESLTREGRGRRVFLSAAEESLLLQKPAGIAPHGGGRRISPDGPVYDLLLSWIESGAPRSQPGTPALQRVVATPSEAQLRYGDSQQVVVTAFFSDGSTRDVTHLSAYQSSDSTLAAVDEGGQITVGRFTGEPAIMARYDGQIAICRVPIPRPESVPAAAYESITTGNFIDQLVTSQLQKLNLPPSKPADDSKFLRRVYLDIIGRMPTSEEARQFLDDSGRAKRAQLVDHLLEQPEYAEHWANKWADLLRPNPYRVGIKAVLNYDAWIREGFRRNKPYDEFVNELLSARGSTFQNGAVTLFRDRRSPDELATMVSQLFLGIRLECAKCHHHPFEVWGQDDFYSFAAYFAEVGRKGTGLSPPISGSEEFVYDGRNGSVAHPVTGETLAARPLFGAVPTAAKDKELRQQLASWIANPENKFFAQVMANRVWADLMGRGLVEPVDDLRATNPASNEALLKALGDHFRDSDFDIKQLIRTIATSKAYALSTLPVEGNSSDTLFHSRYYRQRIRAEVLLDSITQLTGVPESFSAMPAGSSAKEIWTTRVSSVFLDTFGRPDMNQDPPCERSPESTVVQTLHLMNSPNLYAKVISDQGVCAKLAESDLGPAQLIDEIYLKLYARRPSEREIEIAKTHLERNDLERRGAITDLVWALMNTPEFVYKD